MRRLSAVPVALCLYLASVPPVPAAEEKPAIPETHLQAADLLEFERVASPRISPDGSQIVYGRSHVDVMNDGWESELWALDLDGGRHRFLTRGSGPRWSPDGTRIVFHSDRGRRETSLRLYTVGAQGGVPQPLTDDARRTAYPAWSPNGACVVYIAERDSDADNRDVWLIGAGGTGARRLTFHGGFDGDPIWSPDGRSILLSTDRFGGQELALLPLSAIDIERCS